MSTVGLEAAHADRGMVVARMAEQTANLADQKDNRADVPTVYCNYGRVPYST